ncbi:uncharacterized protein LOC142348785 [Convolutriloba macropyga]|uniref:uncharacterized protein LOC142348785 n=1 Tax=Convolutriloba macropyga TaxID=536237 RepID=UPI003F5250AD
MLKYLVLFTSVQLCHPIAEDVRRRQDAAIVNDEDWQSMVFATSDFTGDHINQACAEFSNRFCYLGYVVKYRVGNRLPEPSDLREFAELIHMIHNEINWFSLSVRFSHERGRCCNDQVVVYEKFGQSKGLSAAEFFSRATDFSTHNKRLNYLQFSYNQHLCANVVSLLGFGQGRLRLRGETEDMTKFILVTTDENDLLYAIKFENIVNKLSFSFFKQNVICKDQAWICEQFPN